jgi:hypothetical protein
VRRFLDALDAELVVDEGLEVALVATVNSPKGHVVLR